MHAQSALCTNIRHIVRATDIMSSHTPSAAAAAAAQPAVVSVSRTRRTPCPTQFLSPSKLGGSLIAKQNQKHSASASSQRAKRALLLQNEDEDDVSMEPAEPAPRQRVPKRRTNTRSISPGTVAAIRAVSQQLEEQEEEAASPPKKSKRNPPVVPSQLQQKRESVDLTADDDEEMPPVATAAAAAASSSAPAVVNSRNLVEHEEVRPTSNSDMQHGLWSLSLNITRVSHADSLMCLCVTSFLHRH